MRKHHHRQPLKSHSFDNSRVKDDLASSSGCSALQFTEDFTLQGAEDNIAFRVA